MINLNEMYGFYYEFNATLSVTAVIVSQLIKPFLFTSLWSGSVSVDLIFMVNARIKGN
jgi:hypothetical protein